jgi:hypothetical protein
MARWAGHVARVGDNKNVYVVSMGILEGKGLLGRRRRRWKDNIKNDLKRTRMEGRERDSSGPG